MKSLNICFHFFIHKTSRPWVCMVQHTTVLYYEHSYCFRFLFWHPLSFLIRTCFISQAELSHIYCSLFSNFKPDVLNPLVLICGCWLYYKLGAIFIHIKYNTAKSRREKGTIPNYSAHDLNIVFIQWLSFKCLFLFTSNVYRTFGIFNNNVLNSFLLISDNDNKGKNLMLHLRRPYSTSTK